MKKILNNYDFFHYTITIYYDISISKNLMQHSRTKYIDIIHHLIRDVVESKIVSLECVNIEYQLVDLFIKPLNGLKFKFLRKVIGVCNIP